MRSHSTSTHTNLFIFFLVYSILIKIVFISGIFPEETINPIMLSIGEELSLFLNFSVQFSYALLIFLLHKFIRINDIEKKLFIPLLGWFLLISLSAIFNTYNSILNIDMDQFYIVSRVLGILILAFEIYTFIIIFLMPLSLYKNYLKKFAWLMITISIIDIIFPFFLTILDGTKVIDFIHNLKTIFFLLSLLHYIPWLIILQMMLKQNHYLTNITISKIDLQK